MSDQQQTVLIVGAGPTGLATAIFLARFGIRCLLVERRGFEERAPKAHVVNPRTLEVLKSAGLDLSLFEAKSSPESECHSARFVTRLLGRELGSIPFEAQCRSSVADPPTPTPFINIAQPAFELVLRDVVATLPGVELRIGHRWISSTQDGGNVRSIIESDGRRYEIDSRYVLAADGAGSPVRASLGIAMEGDQNVLPLNMIHFRADLRERLRHRPGMLHWVTDPAVMGVFIAYDMSSNWVFNCVAAGGAELTDAQGEALVREALGQDVDLEIRHVSPWTMTAQVAERYREGRIFLVGDAAHRFPPSGGLGLNTGVQDAHNLAWKIAAVEQGWGDPALLDSYQTERRPIAWLNTLQSLKNARLMMEMFQALACPVEIASDDTAFERWIASGERRQSIQAAIQGQYEHHNMPALHLGFSYAPDWKPAVISKYQATAEAGVRLPHAWLSSSERRVSTLDLIDMTRFTLLTGKAGDSWLAFSGLAAPTVTRTVQGEGEDIAAWLKLMSLTADGAVLVRPDGHIAGRVSNSGPDAQAEMQGLLSQAVGHRPRSARQ